MYREAYYNKNSQDHSLEIIISKNRNGPVGSLAVNYNQETGRIEERKESNLPL
ncbi:DnaB-like helicase C-terminal domain-containing protein [Bacillus sp. UNC41MFS5]|uniref:DnaB-like helicase C-terminal domain-containing protein n=1 Tax=Bacillus sp. UNC41MFS5 TaxID=1449046 RepID=UPI001E611B46|nr:DnaB-like helicase C-terminal domain-containing protein [Bacillus sp. UNC41MFS5]